ncbi:hypothetical protein LE191_04085 [Janthinobacterium sp. HSC-3S05]|uniref:hypothetical protein n=1 Tax=Janthinobacterium lividum TaxID=29581 RepID=UPI001CD8EB39|nr:hypothetical protein [Janthinobacterium lividum]MCA1859288.1 hypothetical protein [Janthinobacterium lividum]
MNPISQFEEKISSFYSQFLLNAGYFAAGEAQLRSFPPNYSVQVTFNPNEASGKIPMAELRSHSDAVQLSISELFQIKAIAAWNDLLTELFSHYVSLHFDGTPVPLLGAQTAKINFSASDDVSIQVKDSIIDNFSFQTYAIRISTIRKIIDSVDATKEHLAIVRKHVSIRNATQHHDGRVYEKMCSELGIAALSVLNSDGMEVKIALGEKIPIASSEINVLKSTLLKIAATWKLQLS